MFLISLSLIPGRISIVNKFPMDKVLHFFAFSYLGFLSGRSLGWWGVLVVLVFGVGNEFLQYLTPGRNVAFFDIASNELGIIVGFIIGYARRKRAVSES